MKKMTIKPILTMVVVLTMAAFMWQSCKNGNNALDGANGSIDSAKIADAYMHKYLVRKTANTALYKIAETSKATMRTAGLTLIGGKKIDSATAGTMIRNYISGETPADYDNKNRGTLLGYNNLLDYLGYIAENTKGENSLDSSAVLVVYAHTSKKEANTARNNKNTVVLVPVKIINNEEGDKMPSIIWDKDLEAFDDGNLCPPCTNQIVPDLP